MSCFGVRVDDCNNSRDDRYSNYAMKFASLRENVISNTVLSHCLRYHTRLVVSDVYVSRSYYEYPFKIFAV